MVAEEKVETTVESSKLFLQSANSGSVTDDLDRENGSSAVTKSGGSSLSIRVNVGTVTEGVSELEHRKHACSVYPTFHLAMYQLGGMASRTPPSWGLSSVLIARVGTRYGCW